MLTFDAPFYQAIRRGIRYLFSSYLLPTLIAALYLLYAVVCLAGEPLTSDMALPAATETSPAQIQPLPAVDYLRIGEWHLFGQAEAAERLDDANIQETQLQLKLLGTFVSTAQKMAISAVIQADDGSQQKYKVDDTLPGGAVLEEISANRILLSHNGRRESLALQRLDAGLAADGQ